MCSPILVYLLTTGILFPIGECFNPALTNVARNYSKNDMRQSIFDRTRYPPAGVIPLLNRKIFRGMRVSIRENPYVASIRRNVAHYLVGTILTKNVVVTVAHPLINVSIAELSVVVGENYSDRGSMLLTVILMIIHENFNESTLEHDIALLKIFEDITFKGSAKSIPLVYMSQTLEDRKAFVTGWGRCDRTGRELCLPRSSRYTEGEKYDPMLRTVAFTLTKNKVYCHVYIRNGLRLGPGTLCLGDARAVEPVAECMAVPGAPLVVEARLTGILSWGFGCSHALDLPLIYTNIKYYQPWLVHNVKTLRSIAKVYFLKLFQAKRAFILREWLRRTRILPPEPYTENGRHLEPLLVDKSLAKLSGTVYDIRDFLFNGVHHKFKLRLYEKLRESYAAIIKERKKAKELKNLFKKRNDKLTPFIVSYNQTEDAADDASIAVESPEGNGDYEEYGVN